MYKKYTHLTCLHDLPLLSIQLNLTLLLSLLYANMFGGEKQDHDDYENLGSDGCGFDDVAFVKTLH